VSLELGTQGDIALLQIDYMLLFPVIDRLLGGTGGPSELSREVTEIEDLIAKEFIRLICQELQTAWHTFGISVSAAARKPLAQLQTLFTASDTALVFGFSVTMQSAGGDFELMLPVASLGPFLGAGTIAPSDVSRKGTMTARLADKLLGTTFGVELALLGGKVPATDLLNLSVGKILQLGVSVRTPAILKIEGHDSFDAVPVRSGNRRGAQLLNRKAQSQPETETKI
jgi:flagellar motor switch protein FliM